jgi:hypothetical protein
MSRRTKKKTTPTTMAQLEAHVNSIAQDVKSQLQVQGAKNELQFEKLWEQHIKTAQDGDAMERLQQFVSTQLESIRASFDTKSNAIAQSVKSQLQLAAITQDGKNQVLWERIGDQQSIQHSQSSQLEHIREFYEAQSAKNASIMLEMKHQLEWQKNLIQMAFKQIQDECHGRCAALEEQLAINRRDLQKVGDYVHGIKRPHPKPPTLSVDIDEVVAKRSKPAS